MQRLPKLRGFRSYKQPAEIVYTGQLNALKAKSVDNFSLSEAGLISSPYVTAKLLVKGELTRAVTVKLQAASENAAATVQKAGGSFEAVPRVGRDSTRKKKD